MNYNPKKIGLAETASRGRGKARDPHQLKDFACSEVRELQIIGQVGRPVFITPEPITPHQRAAHGYPAFVKKEFRRYLDCGILANGFARLRCPTCGFERLVAFSCKGRLCPSCWAKRAADTAAHLVDHVLPEAGSLPSERAWSRKSRHAP
jgi:hypothetical protein